MLGVGSVFVSEVIRTFNPKNIMEVPSFRRDGLVDTQLGNVRSVTTLRVNGVYRAERESSVSKMVRSEMQLAAAESARKLLEQQQLELVPSVLDQAMQVVADIEHQSQQPSVMTSMKRIPAQVIRLSRRKFPLSQTG